MRHTGMLFLSRHRPIAGHSKCGTFQVQLQVYDRINPHQTEPWQITWAGPDAQHWWQQHGPHLKPGAALQVELETARTHTLYTRPPQSFIQARVISLEIAPAAHKSHAHGNQAPAQPQRA